MGRMLRKLRRVKAMQAAAQAQAQANAKATAEKQAIANASAVTDNGRQTDIVNDTTETPETAAVQQQTARPANPTDELAVYINDLRNRHKKRGAALPQLSGVLGQVGALGV